MLRIIGVCRKRLLADVQMSASCCKKVQGTPRGATSFFSVAPSTPCSLELMLEVIDLQFVHTCHSGHCDQSRPPSRSCSWLSEGRVDWNFRIKARYVTVSSVKNSGTCFFFKMKNLEKPEHKHQKQVQTRFVKVCLRRGGRVGV